MPRNTLPRRLLCAAILAALGIHPAVAAKPDATTKKDGPPICPGSPALPAPESRLPEIAADDDRIHVEADRIEARLNQAATFTGHVELRRGNLHLFADTLNYNQAENHIDAQGSIHLRREDGSAVLTPRLQYDIDPGLGSAEDAQFDLPDGQGRGRADNIRFEAKDVLKFDSVRYTTCPPKRNDWFLNASRLTLDKSTETGTATNVWFTFMHVPVFYTPYLSFPLTDERRTGLLAPLLGHNTRTGFLVATPYYINLAPNMDDTLTPYYLSERGLKLDNEFRYLGTNYKGQIDMAYLPNDRQTGSDRERLRLRHDQNLSPLWSVAASAQWVSDNNYFIDLGAASTDSGLTHLPRDLRLDYADNLWRFRARASSFQTLDDQIPLGNLPYQRLPQLLLSANSSGSPNTLHAGFESEWVNFHRPDSTTGLSVTGQRIDLMPSLSLPLRTSYFYLTPKAALRYTAWRLENASGVDATGTTVTRNSNPERILPLYSVDTGLALERESDWFGSAYVQTLEPRLYYVHIPYRDQDSLPVFDTAIPDFNFLNFFRENRFVGADRVGDANQVTAAITSRFILPASGIEQARVSFGQVRYYEDQRVNLPPGPISLTSSDLIGEVGARFGQAWYLRSGLQWDNKVGETRKGVLYLHYRPDPDRIVNIGYRYLNTPPAPLDEQYDVSSQWTVGPRWKLFGRWNYSMTEQHIVQTYAGVERNTCCWSARLTLRQRLLPDGTQDHGVLLEFGLSGFSELGQGEENPLKQGKFIFE